jgi:hypothetical protein
MRTILTSFFLSGLLGMVTAGVQAQQRPAVVELFTSEGCSSCPPAEVLLGELALRPDVLALAFHVDYWDELGWPDRFVIPQATPRQRSYGRNLGLPSIYTPQVVIDGTENLVGSDRGGIANALLARRDGVPVSISVHDSVISINVGAETPGWMGDVTLIAFQRSAVSHIGRGENSGRTLNEYNIVRTVTHLGRYAGGEQTYHAELSALPKDATDIAVVVQAPNQRAVLGAARVSVR